MKSKKKEKTKKCGITGVDFPESEFTKNSASLDGLHSNSKEAEKFRKLTGFKSSELKTMFDSLLRGNESPEDGK
ncbi:MAG: hypothetical protein ACJ0NM_03240 [Flavobacteriaceae bacterium]